jgi:hypothetical protein
VPAWLEDQIVLEGVWCSVDFSDISEPEKRFEFCVKVDIV